LRAGLDVNLKVKGEWTPLVFAIRANLANPLSVAELLKCGARPNEKDSGEWTALHYAAQLRALSSVQLLLEYGANPHTLTKQGQSPFSLCRGVLPKDRQMTVATLLRKWLVECFARAFVVGIATGNMKEQAFEVAWRSMIKRTPE
jgi:ankyrin repeat protein